MVIFLFLRNAGSATVIPSVDGAAFASRHVCGMMYLLGYQL